MSKQTSAVRSTSGRLKLGDVLRMLVQDGIIDKTHAEQLYNDRKQDTSNLHPLVVIGEQRWKNLLPPKKPLTIEALTDWLAARAGLDYYHIDPLKLDFGSVSQIISKAYALSLIHISEPTRRTPISYAVFCLKK